MANTHTMQAVFLGTGTSVGVPVIGCDCRVCTSADPRNKRRRTSLYVVAGDTHVLVDAAPDFREQALAYQLPRIDAVLFTHAHADHVFGFDDIRRYNTLQDAVIPAYAAKDTLADLQRIFDYVKTERVEGLYRPRIEWKEITGSFEIGPLRIEALPVIHSPAPMTTVGFRFEADGHTLGYVPDCSELPDAAIERLRGVDVMILDALRHRPHRTHMTVERSVEALQEIGADRSYIIHMCHDLDHAEIEHELPDKIYPSYDGLTIEI